uniref:tRNA (5-methylaminomethyl-2-thiouridine)(34)-methyltransferase MnmD n=1 Tax=uncultured Planktosalinus sp. TaxID=1810935 RepID=UPI0030DC289E
HQNILNQIGLQLFYDYKIICILELGFGTGLNAFLTYLEATSNNLIVEYEGVEKYPVAFEEIQQCNFAQKLNVDRALFDRMHKINWEERVLVSEGFHLKKRNQNFKDIRDVNRFDLIYFDAFGARVQPELWTEKIFSSMFAALKKNGVLVTYSAKGSVRRAMQNVGFQVEKLPGPPGKREMLRAVKK